MYQKESRRTILDYLDVELLKMTPAVKIREYIRSINEVYEKRAILRQIRWDFESFDYLLSIFVNTAANDVPFKKKVDCFKILKRAIKDNFSGVQFPREVLDKLFYLYKSFIQLANEDIAWCLSVFLKDQILSDDQVNWLIQNAAKDEFILNRLLRYPIENSSIEEWALQSLDSDIIEGRESELYGILIKGRIPDILKEKNSDELAWGIYYSKTNIETKEMLLLDIAGKSNYRSVCEISYRLNLPNVTRHLIEKIKREHPITESDSVGN